MAHQDYVKRGNPRAKAKKPATRKAAPRKSTKKSPAASTAPSVSLKTKLIAALTLAAVGGFGYFLYAINGSSDNAPVIESKPPEIQKKPEKSSIPPPPKEEKWQYIEELKNKTVEVEVKELEKKGPYLMQCGSFRSSQQAEAMKAKMAFMGLEAEVRKSNGKNGIWYRVVLGPYETKRLAEKDRHKLKRQSISGCKIWNWS